MDINGNSEARIGWGSGFFLAQEPGGTDFLEIDELTEIPFGDDVADDVEVTHFKSPKRRKEYIRGLIEQGEGQMVINYVPGSETDQLIRQAHSDGLVRAFRSELPDQLGEPEYEITGFLYVKSRSRAVQIGDRMQMTVAVRFTGDTDEGLIAEAPGG